MHTIAAEIEEISRVHAVKSGEQIGTGEKDSRYSSSKASIIRSKLVGRSALCISVQRTQARTEYQYWRTTTRSCIQITK